MTKLRLIALCIWFLLAHASWSSLASDTLLPTGWQSTHFADHPLIGSMFDKSGNQVSEKGLLSEAKKAHFLLLGENHDNPDHHVIQSNFVASVVDDGSKPSVVFEMVPRRLEAEINRYDLQTDPQLNDFARRLEWEERGWYTWEIYRPIALAAARHGLLMVAGNLDRAVTRQISKNGPDFLSAEEQAAFALNSSLPKEIEDQLAEELRQSHCNLLPDRALPAMVNVQRARDGSMADAMIRSGSENGAILIAGNGHVRKDRGVPLVLRKRLADAAKKVVAIGLIEVDPTLLSIADYQVVGSADSARYDFVIFTPKFDVTDHCAAMREHFKNLKKSKQ